VGIQRRHVPSSVGAWIGNQSSRNVLRRAALSIAALVLMAGCGGGGGSSTTTQAPRDGGGPAHLPTGASGVRLEKVGDFKSPLYLTQPPGDDRDLFVVQQSGAIIVVRDRSPLSTPFLDLHDRISCCGERGLLSMAFAPDYPKSGLFYVYYTDQAGTIRVVEYQRSQSDPLVADPKSAREVLQVAHPFPNHNGGLALFGPDRLLYLGLGDGGSENDPNRTGQDLSTLFGKLLRIDPRPSNGKPYTVPRDNPFVARSGARPEIYSYGLRNPWRFAFDRVTGALAIADVGQNEFEEVDLVPRGEGRGANFGWSAYEGFARFNQDQKAQNAVLPVFVYNHDAGCSITGGYVVRDRQVPSLYGRYLYGDLCAGELHSFTARPGHRATDDRALGVKVPSLSSFGEDNAGHIYAISLEGPVYRLGPAG
jgi:glucose/arabinose dehydrogenase